MSAWVLAILIVFILLAIVARGKMDSKNNIEVSTEQKKAVSFSCWVQKKYEHLDKTGWAPRADAPTISFYDFDLHGKQPHHPNAHPEGILCNCIDDNKFREAIRKNKITRDKNLDAWVDESGCWKWLKTPQKALPGTSYYRWCLTEDPPGYTNKVYNIMSDKGYYKSKMFDPKDCL